MDIELDTLNAQQRLAVTAPMQPVLVLAGAGSGKTRVLAYRVIYLIKHGLVDAPNILALTFTNKAASEMKERVTSLLQADGSSLVVSLPHLSTFHSLGVKILRQHGYLLGLSRSFVILDTEDQLRLLKDVFTAEHIEESIKPQAVLHFIHAVKNTWKDPEEVAKQYRGYLSQQFLAAYRGYQRALMQQGSVDLDDLICLPERLLREISEVRGYYQHKFRYILVDEYQDTNPIQYQLLRQLAPPAGLFVVGDDAQSIYGFRGSDISNILNFERDFPNATVVVLDQNYRSTQNILAVADAVLKHSVEQKPKVLWTENLVGQKVVVQELSSEVEEADFIVRTLIRDASPAVPDVEASVDEGLVYEEDVPAPIFSVLDYMLQKKRKSGFLPGAPKYIRLPAQHLSLARYAILYRTLAERS
jgi:DNA helicase-2/ATP-dependent DNA helicase PcrA